MARQRHARFIFLHVEALVFLCIQFTSMNCITAIVLGGIENLQNDKIHGRLEMSNDII